MRERHKCVLHPFSLDHGFIPLDFSGKVFNEQIIAHSEGYCTLFPSLKVFPTRFYFSKVLMRHILNKYQGGVL